MVKKRAKRIAIAEKDDPAMKTTFEWVLTALIAASSEIPTHILDWRSNSKMQQKYCEKKKIW